MAARVVPLAGWGRYPVAECALHRPSGRADLAELVGALPDLIVRGNGRSYGDAALNPRATVAATGLDRLIAFDAEIGDLTCEAGVLLADLIDIFLPRGWIVPVTPGTRFVSVGGMIAADVHGKNHHGAGSFCEHVEWIDLALGDGQVLRCSHTGHPELFAATCGGMGLTGAILAAKFRMMRLETAYLRQKTLRAPDLASAMAAFESALGWTYAVAWIDCLASGARLGRSVVLLGEHVQADQLKGARRDRPFGRPNPKTRRVPFDLPSAALGRMAVKLFNRAYYAAHSPGEAQLALEPFFYPLDAVRDWNRIYGRRGFVQFQCVLPLAVSAEGLRLLLEAVAARGQASFLAVLKRLGRPSFGMLSFPMEGYTLALDFPANPANLALIERLGAITQDHGGRIYLAKDALATPASVAAGYPRLEEFRALRARYGLTGRFASLLSERLELA